MQCIVRLYANTCKIVLFLFLEPLIHDKVSDTISIIEIWFLLV